jgi:predicted NAD/FAD-binding protein
MAVAARAEVAVIGAGWAGLAAAIHLVKVGRSVRLIDAAPQAGGRARRLALDWKHPSGADARVELDNGQHLLLGAYSEVMALLKTIGHDG